MQLFERSRATSSVVGRQRNASRSFDVAEARAYWRRLHAVSQPSDSSPAQADLLQPVCHPGQPTWFNSYVAQSQRRAFTDALPRAGDLRGRDVLEIGCGTGRWTVILRDTGANVRAVDVSAAAIAANARRIRGVEFECADLLDLPLGDESIDLAVSVTVIQHVPHDAQARAAAELARVLRRGGCALLLENTKDVGQHVFARSINGWKALFARHGFDCLFARGYAYDLPLRAGRAMWSLRRVGRASSDTALLLDSEPGTKASRFHELAYRPFVAASRLLEPVTWRFLPDDLATHCAFVFERVR